MEAFFQSSPSKVKELDQLPFKYLCFGFGGADEDVLHSNVELSKELRLALDRIRAAGCREEDTYLSDPTAAEAISRSSTTRKLSLQTRPAES
jgi:hypothetical protein